MGVINVEPAGLQGLEARLNLPTHFINVDGFLGLVERQDYLKFGLAVEVLHPCGGEVAVLVVDEVDARKVLGYTHLELFECPKGLEVLAVVRVVQPEVFADAYVVAYAVVVKPSNPMLADELAVGHEAVDLLGGDLPAEGRGEPHEVDGAHRDERDCHLRHELEARQIDCFSEVDVQDVE